MRRLVLGIGVYGLLAAGAAAQMTKYGVTVTAEKNVDFAKFATYSWTPGQPSPSKQIDGQIIAAMDKELGALGLKKAASGPGDVLATYYSLTRTDSDLKAKPDANGRIPQQPVGTLVFAMLDAKDRKRLLRLRIDQPIDPAPGQLEAEINRAVTALFEKYPTRTAKK